MVIRLLNFMFRTLRVVRALIASCVTAVLDAAFPPRDSERLVRGLTPEVLYARMEPLIIPLDHTYIGTCIALIPYRFAGVEACIIEAKFHGSAKATQFLGQALAKHLHNSIQNQQLLPGNFILIPLPLSSNRLRDRGYCQTERIAIAGARALRVLSTENGIRCFLSKRINENDLQIIDATLLVRARHTIPQTKLSGRERRKNLQGAFAATKPCDPQLTYIVIDDVVTTGSTLLAAVETLQAAGAQRVLSLALAHADLHL